MDTAIEQSLLKKIRLLPSEQINEANDFIDFLISKKNKNVALNRLIAYANQADLNRLPDLDEALLMHDVQVVRQARKAH